MKRIFSLIALIPALLFAITEEEYLAKLQQADRECADITAIVPCAVAEGVVANSLNGARTRADTRARAALAKSIEAFVSHAVSDSSYIEGDIAQEFSTAMSQVKVTEKMFGNSPVEIAYSGLVTDDSGGKTYRAIAVAYLNRELYAEAKKEISKLPPAAVEPAAASPKSEAIPKNTAKQIATKAATFLLGIAKKFVGIP